MKFSKSVCAYSTVWPGVMSGDGFVPAAPRRVERPPHARGRGPAASAAVHIAPKKQQAGRFSDQVQAEWCRRG